MVWLLAHPSLVSTLSQQQVVSHLQSSSVSPVEHTDSRGGGRGAKSYDREKAWPSINNAIHSGGILQIFVQCYGSGMFIPNPNVFRPGSRIFSIPDPHQII
jgi:hypothetical protein